MEPVAEQGRLILESGVRGVIGTEYRKFRSIAKLAPLFGAVLLGGCSRNMVLLNPDGPVGTAEKNVILIALALMLIVVVPVIAMTFFFAWRYRASNKKATYAPKWAHSYKVEAVVWLVPAVIVAALGTLAWQATHDLSPYEPLASAQKPVRIEAIALDWKWLFIYPDQHIATVNQIVFPANRPVSFRLTSDAVMTAFFIPKLGSMIYAMPGMQTKLNLEADKAGTYIGRNFQLSGKGYSWMKFQAVATSPENFAAWIKQVKAAPQKLDATTLAALEKPSIANPVAHYASVPSGVFDQIINQVMTNKPMTASAAPPHASHGA